LDGKSDFVDLVYVDEFFVLEMDVMVEELVRIQEQGQGSSVINELPSQATKIPTQ
ncbi:hypothetical protein Tco_1151985, partial [Tanacetum coccineum]